MLFYLIDKVISVFQEFVLVKGSFQWQKIDVHSRQKPNKTLFM